MAAPYVARVYMNSDQKRLLVEFMERHRDFATNRLNSNYPTQHRNELWQELTNILNAEQTGVAKEMEGWKKSWKELKASVKEKVAKMKACPDKGGSKRSRAVPLTPLEERVLKLIGIPLPRKIFQESRRQANLVPRTLLESQVLPYGLHLESSENSFNDVLPCNNQLQVAENTTLTPIVETSDIVEESMPIVEEHFRRSFYKQERSPSPHVEPEVSHPEVAGMYFETDEMNTEREAEDRHKQSAYARLADAQEELVVLKRNRYQQKKQHEEAMLSVFREFVDCIRSAFPPKK